MPEGGIPAGQGAFVFKGTWNAATNTPTLGDGGAGGLNGDVYRVSVAGTTLIDGEGDWQIGDLIMRTDTVWIKADNTDPFNYAEYQGNEDVGIGGGSGWEIVKAFTFAGLTPGTEYVIFAVAEIYRMFASAGVMSAVEVWLGERPVPMTAAAIAARRVLIAVNANVPATQPLLTSGQKLFVASGTTQVVNFYVAIVSGLVGNPVVLRAKNAFVIGV